MLQWAAIIARRHIARTRKQTFRRMAETVWRRQLSGCHRTDRALEKHTLEPQTGNEERTSEKNSYARDGFHGNTPRFRRPSSRLPAAEAVNRCTETKSARVQGPLSNQPQSHVARPVSRHRDRFASPLTCDAGQCSTHFRCLTRRPVGRPPPISSNVFLCLVDLVRQSSHRAHAMLK